MKSPMPRDLALKVLNNLDRSSGFADLYLENVFDREPYLSGRDRAFLVHLVQGVLRWRLRLDWIIERAIRFPFKKIEPHILNILRLSLYQIFFMDRVPESAAVNEAVKQARSRDRRHLAGFVNGILRDICRRRHLISFPDREKDQIQYLSVYYSYPTWLVEKWIRELGSDFAERILAAGNRIPDLVVRANRLKTDRQELIRHMEAEGVCGEATRYSPDGIRIENPGGPVNQLKAFGEGLFQVQGEAAQVCSHLLCPKSGEHVLDCCAGLGGKSTHIAELMGNNGLILALDINHDRLVRLSESSRRLKIDCIRPVVTDAGSRISCLLRGSFDKVLVDVPCSGLGVVSKHPDAKWSRQKSDIERLALLQVSILNEAGQLLRKEGRMLYVTCTISREENEEVVQGFLEKNPEIALLNLKDHVPEWGEGLIDDQGFFRSLPHVHGMDGFFAALFMKKGS